MRKICFNNQKETDPPVICSSPSSILKMHVLSLKKIDCNVASCDKSCSVRVTLWKPPRSEQVHQYGYSPRWRTSLTALIQQITLKSTILSFASHEGRGHDSALRRRIHGQTEQTWFNSRSSRTRKSARYDERYVLDLFVITEL